VSTTAPAPDRQLIVDLSDRQVYVYQQQKVLVSYPIAIGKDGWETPQGTFQVEQKRTNPQWTNPINGETMSAGPDNPLGSRWIGFWSDATSEIGFHGTNQEELIGMAVSHGCLRMRNQDVEDLFEKVKVGTLVTIRP
jgi:lipoprotein-anchoring transpeptidase ErfK/SrfK